MTALMSMKKKQPERETLTEAYEVRAFRDESEAASLSETVPVPEVLHAELGALQAARERILGHGEQRVVPDDCQFGDNDLCFVEA